MLLMVMQNLQIGAEVRGTVDGAFDSGYLMTANVNGQLFRGVLFAPVNDRLEQKINVLSKFDSFCIGFSGSSSCSSKTCNKLTGYGMLHHCFPASFDSTCHSHSCQATKTSSGLRFARLQSCDEASEGG